MPTHPSPNRWLKTTKELDRIFWPGVERLLRKIAKERGLDAKLLIAAYKIDPITVTDSLFPR